MKDLQPIARRLCLGTLLTVVLPWFIPTAQADGRAQLSEARAKQKTTPSARVLLVGSTRRYKVPSAAAAAARRGDTIRIDAGEYRDCAVWRTPHLIIEGTGGYAHVRDRTCEGKAIWVFYDSPVTIRKIRFSGARVAHRNGAGIRWEGKGRLTVAESWFENNQMGILVHNNRASQLVVSKSRFERNGNCDTFCGHAIYAGRITSLVVRSSQFENHRLGHHIKSRANFSRIVGNRIIDGAKGNSSFAINLPNSGTAVIQYNFIQKGPMTDNANCMICIGEEISNPSQRNPSRGILIERNSFRNDSGKPNTVAVWNRGPDPVRMRSNSYSGPGVEYRGVAGRPPGRPHRPQPR